MRVTHLIALIAAICLLGGCAKPRRLIQRTLDSPRDVELLRWCEGSESNPVVEAWTPQCDGEESAYAIIANAGTGVLQRVRVDVRDVHYVDYDESIPGNTGVVVPEGPVAVEGLAHPTMVVVASLTEPALSVVELVRGKRAALEIDGDPSGDRMTLETPLADLAAILTGEGDAIVVGRDALNHQIRTWRIQASCGETTRYVDGCSASATITTGESFDSRFSLCT